MLFPAGFAKKGKDAPHTPGRCPGANGDEKSGPSLVKFLNPTYLLPLFLLKRLLQYHLGHEYELFRMEVVI
jgi:hypothetical protein